MRLSTKTRYGVRAVFDIAFHGAANPTQAKDIAERQRIPARYLEQIFQELRKAGLVESKRGPRGGYTLKRAPEHIPLSAIVRALQGPIEDLFAVEDEQGPKGHQGSARAITVDLWKDLAVHVASWFDGVSVQDLIDRAEQRGVARSGANVPMYFI